MDKLTENIYDVLFHPQKAMARIAEYPVWWQSIAVFLGSQLIPLIGFSLALGGKVKGVFPVILLFGQLLMSLVLWYIFSALYYFFGELIGGRGCAKGVLCALGFSSLPYVFIVPFYVITVLLPPTVQPLLYMVAMLGLGIWTIVLAVYAIKAALSLRIWQAILVLSSPLLVMIVVFGFMGAAVAVVINMSVLPWH